MRIYAIILLLCPLCILASSLDLIEKSYEQGHISIYEMALHKAAYLLDIESLPAEFRSDEIHSKLCATSLLKEIEAIMLDAPLTYISRYKELKARPTYDGKVYRYLSSQGNFFIHYTGSGYHAPDLTDDNLNGIPDQIEIIADLFELSYAVYHQQLNYILPPSDGSAGGGQDIYDVYIKNWPGYYGFAMPESYANDMPEYPTRTISYIGISSWATGADLRGTIAHEYYHACQMAYYCDYLAYSSWAWDENTAMYTEKLIFPDDGIWLDYTGYRQNHPFYGLWLFDGWYEYCNVIWPLFIREGLVSYDDTFFRTIFEELGLLTTLQEGGFYPQVLNEQLGVWSGYSLAEAYQLFTVWNYLVKDCYDGTGYEDGASFMRQPRIHHVLYYQDLPFSGTGDPASNNEIPPQTYASHYIEIYPDETGPGAMLITFSGEAGKNQEWGYSMLCHDRQHPLNSGWELYSRAIRRKTATIDILLPNPGLFDRIVLIFDNLRCIEELESMNYTYSIELSNAVQIDSIIPDSGHADGGDVITISGANFDLGTKVWFNKIPAPVVTFINNTQVLVSTPAHSPGPKSVSVSTMLHGNATMPDAFVFYE